MFDNAYERRHQLKYLFIMKPQNINKCIEYYEFNSTSRSAGDHITKMLHKFSIGKIIFSLLIENKVKFCVRPKLFRIQ